MEAAFPLGTSIEQPVSLESQASKFMAYKLHTYINYCIDDYFCDRCESIYQLYLVCGSDIMTEFKLSMKAARNKNAYIPAPPNFFTAECQTIISVRNNDRQYKAIPSKTTPQMHKACTIMTLPYQASHVLL